jgi:hypothetical protein
MQLLQLLLQLEWCCQPCCWPASAALLHKACSRHAAKTSNKHNGELQLLQPATASALNTTPAKLLQHAPGGGPADTVSQNTP